MNRHQRRAEGAKSRRIGTAPPDKAAAIRLAMIALASAAPTATGTPEGRA